MRCWNSQKLDHQQIYEIVRQKHEPVLARWTIERCGMYRWVEDLDGNDKIKCNMCHIIVHQEFHGVSNAQNLVSCFYPCAKLEIEKVAYHNVDTMLNHINQYISLLIKNEMEATLSLEFPSVLCIDRKWSNGPSTGREDEYGRILPLMVVTEDKQSSQGR
ncbi:hypothetical protein H5410_045502 [Solanum commersonii]|uniref:Uncharacterized protein n=1 Tax=Solanum commersonii TaxID=4109 RepID=A0A9J5XCX6_SOLCO|nr:hypothetical protein H5410_045502 [Solanum commersonii]